MLSFPLPFFLPLTLFTAPLLPHRARPPLSSLHPQSLAGPQGDAVCNALLDARVGCCLRPWARWMAGLTRHLCLLPLSDEYQALGGRCSGG